MASDTKKEFLQKYMLDNYSRAIPTNALTGKLASLGEYSEPVDSRKGHKKTTEDSDDYSSDPESRYAQPQDAIDTKSPKYQQPKSRAKPEDEDDGDVYELAQQPAEDDEPPAKKPSPKPRSAKHHSPHKQTSSSSPRDEGVSFNPNTTKATADKSTVNTSPDSTSVTHTPKKRPGKKVVEIDYEIASEIRPYRPGGGDSSAGKSASSTQVSISRDNKKVPSGSPPSQSSPKSCCDHAHDSKASSSVPQFHLPDCVHRMSYVGGAPPPAAAGAEAHYEEPWDLKARRLKLEQENKGKKSAKKSDKYAAAYDKSQPIYEEAWDSPSQQRKLEERLSFARSLSQTSETDVYHDAVDSMPEQKSEPQGANLQADGNLKPLPPNTYEDAWDLKNSILEQKIREMQLQASATYEEPWDRSKQQQHLQAKYNAQTSDPGSGNEQQGKSPRHRSGSTDAYDVAWDGNESKSKSFTSRGKYNSVDESKMRGKGRGCNIGQRINPMIPLSNQNWYHGNISRDDAEKMLCVCKEGSYIVRVSSDRRSYSLSIKSSKQYIHVQIEQRTMEDGTMRYILGKNSKEFCSIPEMIDYYTHHRVPLKGAEHITLLHPVECKWS